MTTIWREMKSSPRPDGSARYSASTAEGLDFFATISCYVDVEREEAEIATRVRYSVGGDEIDKIFVLSFDEAIAWLQRRFAEELQKNKDVLAEKEKTGQIPTDKSGGLAPK